MSALDKFLQVHELALSTKDISSMLVADKVMRKVVEKLAAYSEDDVNDIADSYDGELHYNNFLTEREAKNITSKLVAHDGSEGPKWSADSFFSAAKDLGCIIESGPYFNKFALYVTACNIASDQGANINKYTGGDKNSFFVMTYDFAVSQLMDKDRPKWVRWYFDV